MKYANDNYSLWKTALLIAIKHHRLGDIEWSLEHQPFYWSRLMRDGF